MDSFGSAAEHNPKTVSTYRLVPAAAGVLSIVLTYLAATASIGGWGVVSVGVITFLFVAACILPQWATRAPAVAAHSPDPSPVPGVSDQVDDRLSALDEANDVFLTSLNSADMFRLVASRVSEVFPAVASGLVVPDESGAALKFLHFDGPGQESIRGFEGPIEDGLAGRAYAEGRIEIDNGLSLDKACLGPVRLKGFKSSAAIPLTHDGEVFAVFQLFMDETVDDKAQTARMLESVRDRVTPIFHSSLAFERSLSSALTDALTGLPNERAFYMVLENQLAESVRHRDDRPLTVLSIDIRDFGAVNSMLGHTVGDRMLEFVGAKISEHLRKMDFLARTVNDEFNVVLPTATEKVGFEIIERIRSSFLQDEFEIADGEGIAIALNVGWATFWKDGETADQLVRAAQQRKRQAKSEQPSGVLWFPREYVN